MTQAAPASMSTLSPRQGLFLLLAFLLPRLALLAVSAGAAFDIHSYLLVEQAMHSGDALYANPALAGHYPYLPGWAWTLWAVGGLGRVLGGNAVLWFKLPGLVAEAGLLWLLLAWPRTVPDGLQRGYRAAMAYALSPVSWLVTASHGQFDAVVLFLVVAAAFGWGRAGRAAGLKAGLWLGLAILFKSWPILLLPVFWAFGGDRRARWGLLAAALALPLAALLAYAWMEGWEPLFSRLAYAGSMGMGLPEALGRLIQRWGDPSPQALWDKAWGPLMLGLLGAACLRLLWVRAVDWPMALAGAVLGVVALAPALASQYLLWPLPFLALQDPRRAWRYSAAVALPLLVFYLLFFPEALMGGLNNAWFFHHFPVLAWAGLNLALGAYLAWEWRWGARVLPGAGIRP